MEKNISLRYGIQRFFEDAIGCVISAFCVPMLLTKGYQPYETGLILFFGYMLSFFVQPLVASVIDKSEKNLLLFFYVLGDLIAGVLIILNILLVKSKLVFGCIYTVVVSLIDITISLYNTLSIYFNSRNYETNYGLSRALGCIGYGITSLFFGSFIDNFGGEIIIVIAGVLKIITGALSYTFPKVEGKLTLAGQGNSHVSSLSEFMKNNKWFFASIFGVSLLALTHIMLENYLINILERIGGSSTNVGISLCISAMICGPTIMLYPLLNRKVGTYATLLIPGIFFVIKAFLFYTAKTVYVIYAAQFLQITTYNVLFPALMSHAKDCTRIEDMVKGQSTIIAFYTLGCALGNLLGGTLISTIGVRNMILVAMGAAFIGTMIFVITVPKCKYCSER